MSKESSNTEMGPVIPLRVLADNLADTTTTIGSITVNNPAVPTSKLASMVAPTPTVLNSSDGRYAATFEWKMVAVVMVENCSTSYSVSAVKGSTINVQNTAATNYVEKQDVSLGFKGLSARINSSFGWSNSNQKSLMIAETESITYTMNAAPGTTNLIWQLHVTYESLQVGTRVLHRVDQYGLTTQAIVNSFDQFQLELAEGLTVNLPASPSITGSGETNYPSPNDISPVNANVPVPPTWAARYEQEMETLIGYCLNDYGCTLHRLLPNTYSTRAKTGRCPDPASRAQSIAESAANAATQTTLFPVPFASPDSSSGLDIAVGNAIDDSTRPIQTAVAEFNYRKPSHTCMQFAGSGSGTQTNVNNAYAEDRWVVYNGGFGTLGGVAAAKDRFDTFNITVQLVATFSWGQITANSVQVVKPPTDQKTPYHSVDIGQKNIRNVGNTSTQAQTQTSASTLGMNFPITLGGASLGNIGFHISKALTTKEEKTYALTLNESTSINRTFSFKTTKTEPFWMVYTVYQLNISYEFDNDTNALMNDLPDVFLVRSQVTSSSS